MTALLHNENDDRQAEVLARLVRREHSDAHGGVIVLGETVAVFSNMGDQSDEFPEMVKRELAARGIGLLGFGRSGPEHVSDAYRLIPPNVVLAGIEICEADYSWAMLVDVWDGETERINGLVRLVRDVVRMIRDAPDYPSFQFQRVGD